MDDSNDLTLLNNYGANALMEIDVDEVPKELEEDAIDAKEGCPTGAIEEE